MLNLAYNKNKLYKTLDYWSRDMLNFNFWKKHMGLVFPSHSVYDFSRKIFLMFYSINWLNCIVWLSLLLEILSNICITIVCIRGCYVIKFDIKVNESQYIALCVVSGSIKKLLSIDCVNIYFSQSIVNYVSFLDIFSIDLKVWAYPTLVISWFISFNLIFLIKLFCYITKKSRQKFKYLENKKSIWREMKIIFHYF